MVRYAKVAEHVHEKSQLLVVYLAPSALASLPGATGAIEDEDELDVQRKEAADAVEHGLFDALERLLVGRVSNGIDLLRREVVEAPVGFVDGDAKGLAMASVVVFGELRNWDAFLVVFDRVPEPVAVLAGGTIRGG
jgi:hypothetical protein